MMMKTLFAMMSRVLLFISFFCSLFLTAQQQHFDLKWSDEVTFGYEGAYQKIPGFDAALMNYDEVNGLYYVNQWSENGLINSRTVRLTNIKYETISRSYIKDIPLTTIPEKINFEVKTATARGLNSGVVKMSPIIFENGVYKKVISFDITYKTTNNFAAKTISSAKLAVSNSVLASGEWYKFAVNETGIHRITPEFLTSLGINLNGVDPNTIKIYGHGGKTLPLLNSLNTDFDLPEIGIRVVGGEDGTFTNNDVILFYAESTLGYVKENDSHINPYADTSYYYITFGGAAGKRISNGTEPSDPATVQISSYRATLFEEKDLVTLSKSGRRWFGDKFDIELQRDYSFDFPEIVPGTSFDIQVKAASKSRTASKMDVLFENEILGTLNFRPIVFPNLANEASFSEEITATKSMNRITLRYDQGGNPGNEGYLDYIRITGTVPLKGFGEQFNFSNEDQVDSGVGAYTISDAEDIAAIWEVTDPKRVVVVANNNGGASSISFKSLLGDTKQYVALHTSDFLTPEVPENTRVNNQNLKGAILKNGQGQFEDLDYLIVTSNELMSAANRLADFHQSTNGLTTKVVSLDLIYNEFSSGKQDVSAIRNFVRYVYENASTPEKRIKYLCLFGDTSVDYKNNRLNVNNNIVPVFQSVESNNVRVSFMTDDFYVMLDPEEGEIRLGDKLDLAVGRMLVDNPNNANAAVDKVIAYSSRSSFGSWRNRHLYISDDVDAYWEETIQSNLDALATKVDSILPSSNIQKIHMDAFKQESIAGGRRYPEAKSTMLNAIESGVLLVNYFGHGGEEGLASEFLFTKVDAQDLLNTGKYPLFITVTCNFTKFDNPERITAGEIMYANKDGGAVSMITTTRQISVTAGIIINDKLPDFLFPEDERYSAISQSVVDTKNSIINSDSRVVFFIGDPAMKLSIPERQIQLTKINDVPITNDNLQALEALSKIKLSGEVFKGGARDDQYNGVLSTVVFDKEEQRTTLANDGTRENADGSGDIIKLTFNELGNVIFKGKSSVKNGMFDVEFIVPRDIKIPIGTGRVSFYSENSNSLEDQAGRNTTIRIGGINENAPEDVQGPSISLFLNDENFVSGGTVNNSPILIAKLQDENGINTSSGIGHDIIAILDGDETNPIVLNDFYETSLDDFTTGSLNFKLRDLAPGIHTLSVRVWDVYNNSSTQELEFVVLENEDFVIENVLNYPNPLINYTEFWFSHNNPDTAILDVQVQIFTVSGKVIWTRNQTVSGKRTYQNEITWDGRDNFGDRVGKGVYVYKISVKSTLTNKTVEKFEKLVLL